jgi:hypothetical protein
MKRKNLRSHLVAAVMCALASAVIANDSVTWTFDKSTEGEDVFWLSSTAIRTDAAGYDWYFELQKVEVWVEYLGITFGPIDITDDLPPEAQQQSGFDPGPLPLLIIDDHVRYPEPPEPVTIEGDLQVLLRADGYGEWSFTNVTLGTAVVDLGWPFGEQTVNLKKVRMVGYVDVAAFSKLGDINYDGRIDQADLSILLASYGFAAGEPGYLAAADLNNDGQVDQVDLALLLSGYGYGM